jgi:hypothetical protein
MCMPAGLTGRCASVAASAAACSAALQSDTAVRVSTWCSHSRGVRKRPPATCSMACSALCRHPTLLPHPPTRTHDAPLAGRQRRPGQLVRPLLARRWEPVLVRLGLGGQVHGHVLRSAVV